MDNNYIFNDLPDEKILEFARQMYGHIPPETEIRYYSDLGPTARTIYLLPPGLTGRFWKVGHKDEPTLLTEDGVKAIGIPIELKPVVINSEKYFLLGYSRAHNLIIAGVIWFILDPALLTSEEIQDMPLGDTMDKMIASVLGVLLREAWSTQNKIAIELSDLAGNGYFFLTRTTSSGWRPAPFTDLHWECRFAAPEKFNAKDQTMSGAICRAFLIWHSIMKRESKK